MIPTKGKSIRLPEKNGLYNICILLWIRGVKTGVEVELLSETKGYEIFSHPYISRSSR